MMNHGRRFGEAAQRLAERRRREDGAPRLHDEVPALASLVLEVEERVGGSPVGEPSYKRRVVVDSAPALFVLHCGDSRCTDGGHDVTYAVLHALRAGRERFEGEDACHGAVGSAACARTVRYVGLATYRQR